MCHCVKKNFITSKKQKFSKYNRWLRRDYCIFLPISEDKESIIRLTFIIGGYVSSFASESVFVFGSIDFLGIALLTHANGWFLWHLALVSEKNLFFFFFYIIADIRRRCTLLSHFTESQNWVLLLRMPDILSCNMSHVKTVFYCSKQTINYKMVLHCDKQINWGKTHSIFAEFVCRSKIPPLEKTNTLLNREFVSLSRFLFDAIQCHLNKLVLFCRTSNKILTVSYKFLTTSFKFSNKLTNRWQEGTTARGSVGYFGSFASLTYFTDSITGFAVCTQTL